MQKPSGVQASCGIATAERPLSPATREAATLRVRISDQEAVIADLKTQLLEERTMNVALREEVAKAKDEAMDAMRKVVSVLEGH